MRRTGWRNWLTGAGYVEKKDGEYARAIDSGVDVHVLLFETLGGFSPAVVALLRRCAEARQNRLARSEYDATTWSARTWMSFNTQKISVALHTACAMEIADALGLPSAVDPRSC